MHASHSSKARAKAAGEALPGPRRPSAAVRQRGRGQRCRRQFKPGRSRGGEGSRFKTLQEAELRKIANLKAQGGERVLRSTARVGKVRALSSGSPEPAWEGTSGTVAVLVPYPRGAAGAKGSQPEGRSLNPSDSGENAEGE